MRKGKRDRETERERERERERREVTKKVRKTFYSHGMYESYMYMWQSRREIEYYSVMYFKGIAEFDVL